MPRMATTPTPEAAPAPESERPAVPPEDLAAAQMRMLLVGEILAEEAEEAKEAKEAQHAQPSSEDPGEAAGGAKGAAPPPVLRAPDVAGAAEQTEAGEVEDPPPLDD